MAFFVCISIAWKYSNEEEEEEECRYKNGQDHCSHSELLVNRQQLCRAISHSIVSIPVAVYFSFVMLGVNEMWMMYEDEWK